MSLHTYNDSLGRFPQTAMPHPRLPLEERLSWFVTVMPFIESNRIYNKMDRDQGWAAEENRFAALLVVRSFQCPAYPEQRPVSTLAPTHYPGLTGLGADAAALPRDDPRAGFFGDERKLVYEDFKGRGSDIVVMAETTRASGAWTAAGTPTSRCVDPNGGPYIGRGGQFGGMHSGGANAALADGTVRLFSDRMDPAAWEALATLRGRPAGAGGGE
jgi:prepilin-type processing-associated H-X9-DG protein